MREGSTLYLAPRRGRLDPVSQSPDDHPGQPSLLVRAKGVLEFGAALGALMFTVLSVMYEQFYGPLGLEPDDVGLTQTVIVQRALAGVLLIAGSGLAVLLALLALQTLNYMLAVAAERTTQRFLSDSQKQQVRAFRERRLVKSLTTLYFVPGVSDVPPPPWRHRRRLALAGVLLVAGAFGLTFANGWVRVQDAAEAAKRGESVHPLTFAGIRVLDIESRACQVHWLGTPQHMPSELAQSDLHCLGGADGTYLFRTAGTTVRVPSSVVSTTFQ